MRAGNELQQQCYDRAPHPIAVTWHSEDLKEKKASHPHRHRMRTERASPAGGWAAGTDRARRGSDRSLIALAAAFAHAQVWFAGLLER